MSFPLQQSPAIAAVPAQSRRRKLQAWQIAPYVFISPFFILFLVAMLVGNFILGMIPLLNLILPTLYGLTLSTFAMFTIFNIVDRKLEVIPAIQASVDTVKANFWNLLAVNIIASVLSIIGVFACGIGVVVTAPMYVATVAVAYRTLHPASAPAQA